MLRLRDYQRAALRFAIGRQYGALYMDMRLGKTCVCIRRVRVSRATLILVVAPYSALYGWREQLADEGERLVYTLTGPREERLHRLEEAVRHSSDIPQPGRVWCLINKEGHRVVPSLCAHHFDAVVLDEATFIKNPRSAVSRYYCEGFRDTILRIVLTGTPAPESELEYLQQLRFLSHRLLPGNYYDTRMRWFTLPKDRPDSHQWYITRRGKAALARALRRVAFFCSRANVQMGGEKQYRTRTVQLPASVRKTYDEVERDFVLHIGDVTDTTIWATQQFIWLRRITGGVVVTDGGPAVVDSSKLDALSGLLTGELARERVVVWATFRAELEYIRDRLMRKHTISCAVISGAVPQREREYAREQFNTGAVRVLVCQPEVFKHGVDLGDADTMIYYSSPCGLETRAQTEDRIVRIGKQRSLLVIDLVIEGTVDEDIVQSLRRKERRSTMMHSLVRGMQGRS